MALRAFKTLITFVLVLFAQMGFAAKILIVTDQPSQKKAKEIKKTIENTPPFSLLKNFSVVVRYLPKNSVSCTRPLVETKSSQEDQASDRVQSLDPSIPASCKRMMDNAARPNTQSIADKEATKVAQEQLAAAQRLLVCDTGAALTEISGKENADRTIFVKESNEWAGAGAGGSSITVTTRLPATGAIHELLHSFGFSDEYSYSSECEADTYCPYLQNEASPNVAVFKEERPYDSDSTARKKHSSQIPWFSRIKPRTLITTGPNLGTPQEKEIGLFQIGVCDKAASNVKSWRPGSRMTVMETVAVGHIPEIYWKQISQSLSTEVLASATKPRGESTSKTSASPEKATK